MPGTRPLRVIRAQPRMPHRNALSLVMSRLGPGWRSRPLVVSGCPLLLAKSYYNSRSQSPDRRVVEMQREWPLAGFIHPTRIGIPDRMAGRPRSEGEGPIRPGPPGLTIRRSSPILDLRDNPIGADPCRIDLTTVMPLLFH